MGKFSKYQATKIESKWQKYWQEHKTFLATDDGAEKFYGLVEFPYPSGEGLHAGHLRSYTAMDVIARYQRFLGKNVLYPMGMDAFGLPAENYAIKKNIPPQETTRKNIDNYIRQLQLVGYSFDWSRFLETTNPEYYRWTQWIFIQMWKEGLAYKAQENINWCPSCLIGLANEEVIGGNCERCGSVVEKKEKEQWLLRITKYADRLIDDLAKVDFLEQIKTQQKNWIGRSDGAEINFSIKDSENKLKIFTTRPDTIFGVTFMVIAPEHILVHDLEDKIENLEEIKKYITASRKKSDLERSDLSREKTGVEIKGLKAINPVNNEELPIFIADYVTVAYGTGAIMAVPAHDQRDWEFAKKYKLEIRPVIEGGDLDKEAYPALNGVKMINCGQFTGLSVADFQIKIVNWLQKNKVGQATVNYRLHDWIFSRQRYWGEPIPMVYCTKCDWQPVAESDLPIVLPDVKDFKPGEEGQSPLAKLESWIKTTCPKCGGEARRETDTMPNWAGSNWYFIRYTDSKNNKQLADPEKIKHWLPVDWYNGGNEHTTLHLLYSRFVFKFLYDIGVIPKTVGDEPYKKRTAQGMILGSGGVKMSKSKGNVVNPDDYIKQYGADALRMYIMFLGPFDQSIAWDDKGVTGLVRFLNRVWDLQNKLVNDFQDVSDKKDLGKSLDQQEERGRISKNDILRSVNKVIKKIGEDIELMKFNTAISQLMILLNEFDELYAIPRDIFEKFIIILSPFAPHISEELWEKLGHQDSITLASWPKFDQALLQNQLVTVGIQVNGKLRDTVELPADTEDSADLQAQICSREKVQNALNGAKVKKFIYIKNKIISLVA